MSALERKADIKRLGPRFSVSKVCLRAETGHWRDSPDIARQRDGVTGIRCRVSRYRDRSPGGRAPLEKRGMLLPQSTASRSQAIPWLRAKSIACLRLLTAGATAADRWEFPRQQITEACFFDLPRPTRILFSGIALAAASSYTTRTPHIAIQGMLTPTK